MRGGSGIRGSRQLGKTLDPAYEKLTPEQRSRTIRRIAGFFRPYRIAVIVVMAYLYLSTTSFLFGAQLDAIIRAQATGALSGTQPEETH